MLTVLPAVSNLAVALTPNFQVMPGARLLLGFALGGFWGAALIVNPRGQAGQRR